MRKEAWAERKDGGERIPNCRIGSGWSSVDERDNGVKSAVPCDDVALQPVR